jgi:hypothetical protein
MERIEKMIYKITEAIDNGVSTDDIRKNPLEYILSGKKKYLMLNYNGVGINIGENIYEYLLSKGELWIKRLDRMINEVGQVYYKLIHPDTNELIHEYPLLTSAIINKEIQYNELKDTNIYILEVPEESWTYSYFVVGVSHQIENIKGYNIKKICELKDNIEHFIIPENKTPEKSTKSEKSTKPENKKLENKKSENKKLENKKSENKKPEKKSIKKENDKPKRVYIRKNKQ